MSSFTALNLSAEDVAFDAEEHTRELQIEEAFKIFQKALKAQKAQLFTEARTHYDDLFGIGVVTNEMNVVSPTIRTLRYLAHRNRGLSHFDELRSGIEELSSDESLNLLFDSMDDLVDSLQYNDGDLIVINLLLSLFKFFGNDRLSRYLIEYELTKEETDDIYTHRNKKLVSSNYSYYLESETFLLRKIGVLNNTKGNENPSGDNLEDLSFLEPIRIYLQERFNNSLRNRTNTVIIETATWKCIATKLQNLIPRTKQKTFKTKDNYRTQEHAFQAIKFELASNREHSSDVQMGGAVDEHEVLLNERREESPKEKAGPSEDMADNSSLQDKKLSTSELVVQSKESTSITVGSTEEMTLVKDEASGNKSISDGNLDNNEDSKNEPLDENTEFRNDASTQANTEELLDSGSKRSAPEGQPQRSSKRFRQPTEETEGDVNKTDQFQDFLKYTSDYLKNDQLDLSALNVESITQSGASEKPFLDLMYCIKNWTPRYLNYLSLDSNKGQNGLALSELINTNIVNASISSDVEIRDYDDRHVLEFIGKVNDSKSNYSEVRRLLLESLLGYTDDSLPLIEYYFDRELYAVLENFVLTTETEYFSAIVTEEDIKLLVLGVGIFEILINYWISMKQKLKTKGQTQKQTSELETMTDQVQTMVERWRRVLPGILTNFENEILKVRFRWCTLLYLQHSQLVSVMHLKKLLSLLYNDFESKHSALTIEYPNFDAIPTLNSKMIKNQSDKLNVLTTFERTLGDDKGTNTEANQVLETILLLDNGSSLTEEEKSMEQFISGSSVSLKLKLWRILFHSYIGSFELYKYQKGLTITLPLLLDQLYGEFYDKQPDLQRHQILLTTIAFYSDYIEGFCTIAEHYQWKMPEYHPVLLQSILDFVKILLHYMIQTYYMGKPSGYLHLPDKVETSLLDTVVNSLVVTFCMNSARLNADDAIQRTSKYDFLSVIHNQLGFLRICDGCNGRFLRLCQDLWKSADSEVYERDILQHLDCRFGITITNGGFTPYDHYTHDEPLDKSSAIAFTSCVMSLISKKKESITSVLKPDLKHALDVFSNAIGDPDLMIGSMQKNEFAINQYLEQDLNVNLFRSAMIGGLEVSLKKSFLEEQLVADLGLFYSQAVNNLNTYKIRKKSMQSKISDLEDVHKMIKSDLLYGSSKPETWFLLGQAFSLQVEDDLIWTSDKLNSFEKKLATAALQRKAILSYIMALNICLLQQIKGSPLKQELISLLLPLFSQELYHSLTKPMAGLSFINQTQKKVLTLEGVSNFSEAQFESHKTYFFNIALQISKMAVKYDEANWQTHYYMAQVLHKLKASTRKVLEAALNSCKIYKNGIEPHYLYIAFIYKYFKQKRLTESKALELLEQVSWFFGELDVPVESDNQIEQHVILALKKINQVDKRKWHHKHHFKISTIYRGMNDLEKAYKEIEPLIILKSSNKNLISIWKPEFEPAGKHFVYTYTYIIYYIKLVNFLADFHKLLLFTKKLRRYGAGMINLNDAWEVACSSLCLLTKEIIRSEPGYTDIEVPKLVYIEFMQASQFLTERYKESLPEDEKELLTLLYEISEIRRMNNGFGSTSQLDDTFNSIYLKIYLKNVTPETKHVFINEQNLMLVKSNGPNVKTKVARRDILAAATNLVKAVEPKLADYKITDERGFTVPRDIIESHIEASKATDKKPNSLPSLEKTETEVVESTPTPKSISVMKTPERKGDESSRSMVESEEEFHTPTNVTFEGEDP